MSGVLALVVVVIALVVCIISAITVWADFSSVRSIRDREEQDREKIDRERGKWPYHHESPTKRRK